MSYNSHLIVFKTVFINQIRFHNGNPMSLMFASYTPDVLFTEVLAKVLIGFTFNVFLCPCKALMQVSNTIEELLARLAGF